MIDMIVKICNCLESIEEQLSKMSNSLEDLDSIKNELNEMNGTMYLIQEHLKKE